MAITTRVIDEITQYLDEVVPPLDQQSMTKRIWGQLFDVRTNNKKTVQLRGRESMPAVRFKPELVDADDLQSYPGWVKRSTKKTFGGTIAWSVEMESFDQEDVVGQDIRNLGDAFDREETLKAAALFDYGALQNTAVPVQIALGVAAVDVEAADGLPFFTQVGRFRTGGITYSNYYPAAATITQPFLEQGLQGARRLTNSIGAILGLKIVRWIVPTTQYENVWRIVKSPGMSDTSNRAENPIQGMDVVEWPDLQNQNRIYGETNFPMKPRRDYTFNRKTMPMDVRGRAGAYAMTKLSNYTQFVYDRRRFFAIGA